MSRQDKAREEIWTMMQQECTTYSRLFDYTARDTRDNKLHTHFRRTICSWIFEVVDHFEYDREVAEIAIYYLDQVSALQTKSQGKAIKRREYQLIGVTAIYLAIKLHACHYSISRPGIQCFANLTSGKFSVEAIQRKELEMLRIMKWRINPPSACRFGMNFIYFIPEYWRSDKTSGFESLKSERLSIFEFSRYVTELTLHISDITFSYTASEIAFASILYAMDTLKRDIRLPNWIRSEFIDEVIDSTNLDLTSVSKLVQLLGEFLRAVPAETKEASYASTNVTNSPVSVKNFHTLAR